MTDLYRNNDTQTQLGRRDQPFQLRALPLEESTATERRATAQALKFWQEFRRGPSIPSLADIEVTDSSTLWRDRFLIRRDRQMAHSVFIVCGPSAREAIGLTSLGSSLGKTVPRPIREEILTACSRAVITEHPEHIEGHYSHEDGGKILFRAAFMPLRALANDLGYIFGAFSSRRANA